MPHACIKPDADDPASSLLLVKVVPGASRDGLAGTLGDRLKVRVAAPPEGGKANAAVIRLVAAAAGVRPAAVMIRSGAASSEKSLLIRGVPPAELASRLGL